MIDSERFDRALFKRLAHNDTGTASGHQGGVVIPKDIDRFFPQLSLRASASNPTVDEFITAELFDGDVPKGIISTRYQFQTWGGRRSPERRLTGNLGPVRATARKGDVLTIQRHLDDPRYYRLRLIRAGTLEFEELSRRLGPRSWGAVDQSDLPVAETAINDAVRKLADQEHSPLVLFDQSAAVVETRTVRIARSRAFQIHVASLYAHRCALCGNGYQSPGGNSEIEAAHIVPRSLKGADDARNGLAFCRSHHWAFDLGLFGADASRRVVVAPAASALAANASLLAFAGKQLREPLTPMQAPGAEALAWHMENIVKRSI